VKFNRAQRRAFASAARHTDKLEARIHEAGHAMARIAVAEMMGWPRDKIIDRIEYGVADRDDGAKLWLANGTYGPFLADGMQRFVSAGREWHWRSHAEGVAMFDRFRRAGCDLKSWAFARYLIALGGAVAEAKFLRQDVRSVIERQFDAGDDMSVLMRDLNLLRRRYLSETMLKLSTQYLRWVFSQPDVWKTILAIARMLKRGEMTPGADIMAVVDQNLKEIKLFDFNDMPQARIRRDPTSTSVATCFLIDLDDWRYSNISGGRQVITDKEFLYARLWCSELIDGAVGHSCKHGDGPHEIRVCVLPQDNRENWNDIGKEGRGLCIMLCKVWSAWCWMQRAVSDRKANNRGGDAVIAVTMLHSVPLELVGFIPDTLNENDPRSAREQLDAGYGGGWQKFVGHTLVPEDGFKLCYPGDPPMHPIALIRLRRERIVIYPHAWVMISCLRATLEQEYRRQTETCSSFWSYAL
jgi:hypothetical protein